MSDYAAAVDAKAREIGRHCVRMTAEAGSGHPSSGLSLAHATTVLMYDVMRWDPADPWNPLSDRLVLSEGHAVPIIYAAYADLGGVVGKDKASARALTVEDLWTLRNIDSVLDGHPNPAIGFPFFDAATGSLGQGVSVAAGLALAARLDGIAKTIFVFCGDGEVREGQVWEALDFVADQKLTNVRVVMNANGMGQSDYVSGQQSVETLARKVDAYGLLPLVVDGHDPDALREALTAESPQGKPVVVIAKTKKGWGVAELQQVGYHGKPLTDDEAAKAMQELEDGGGAAPAVELKPTPPEGKTPAAPKALQAGDLTLSAVAEGTKYADSVAKGAIATRHAYGLVLKALGEASDRVVALDADVSNSTFSNLFGKAFPDRFFECRIAEQNMASVSAGLAAGGKVPLLSSFAKFLVRAYDQIEMAANSCANVKIVGSHSGVSLGADGPSQMGVVDAAFFGALASITTPKGQPGAVVLNPCDGVSTVKLACRMVEHEGLAYMRTLRPSTPIVYDEGEAFDLVGQKVLKEGSDLTLVAWGYMVPEALKAAEALEADGVSCGVVDAYSLPLAADFLDAIGAGEGTKLLVLEDNYAGGIGSAVATAAAWRGGMSVDTMTPHLMPKSGQTADDILQYVGLGQDAILERARALLG